MVEGLQEERRGWAGEVEGGVEGGRGKKGVLGVVLGRERVQEVLLGGTCSSGRSVSRRRRREVRGGRGEGSKGRRFLFLDFGFCVFSFLCFQFVVLCLKKWLFVVCFSFSFVFEKCLILFRLFQFFVCPFFFFSGGRVVFCERFFVFWETVWGEVVFFHRVVGEGEGRRGGGGCWDVTASDFGQPWSTAFGQTEFGQTAFGQIFFSVVRGCGPQGFGGLKGWLGARTQKKLGLEEWEPGRKKKGGGPKVVRPANFVLSSSSWEVFSWTCGRRLKTEVHPKVRVLGFSGVIVCEPRRP